MCSSFRAHATIATLKHLPRCRSACKYELTVINRAAASVAMASPARTAARPPQICPFLACVRYPGSGAPLPTSALICLLLQRPELRKRAIIAADVTLYHRLATCIGESRLVCATQDAIPRFSGALCPARQSARMRYAISDSTEAWYATLARCLRACSGRLVSTSCRLRTTNA